MDKNKMKPAKNLGKSYNVVDRAGEEFGSELDTETIKKNTTPGFKTSQQNKQDKNDNKKIT